MPEVVQSGVNGDGAGRGTDSACRAGGTPWWSASVTDPGLSKHVPTPASVRPANATRGLLIGKSSKWRARFGAVEPYCGLDRQQRVSYRYSPQNRMGRESPPQVLLVVRLWFKVLDAGLAALAVPPLERGRVGACLMPRRVPHRMPSPSRGTRIPSLLCDIEGRKPCASRLRVPPRRKACRRRI